MRKSVLWKCTFKLSCSCTEIQIDVDGGLQVLDYSGLLGFQKRPQYWQYRHLVSNTTSLAHTSRVFWHLRKTDNDRRSFTKQGLIVLQLLLFPNSVAKEYLCVCVCAWVCGVFAAAWNWPLSCFFKTICSWLWRSLTGSGWVCPSTKSSP